MEKYLLLHTTTSKLMNEMDTLEESFGILLMEQIGLKNEMVNQELLSHSITVIT